ncbi:MAG: aminotransferase class V-fold PLP-dependent enzyme, partial [Candidatus Kerfeldbacteria bacterium]|nr:aminotransferase class V-fold PLP-dependent enzyme [Candidatus Kerfeldbacteria bacterium]
MIPSIKDTFPIFHHHPKLVYLDTAATAQKPQIVIDAMRDFYEQTYATIHRGMYDLSQRATDLVEETRSHVA